MRNSFEFLSRVLDSMKEHIAVIDQEGWIVYVNRSWANFSVDNHCSVGLDWLTQNYLQVCDAAAEQGDDFGVRASQGIRSMLAYEIEEFSLEYPCHSPQQKRWFILRVSPFELAGERFLVVAHQDVTERKLAEEAVQKLARLDGLTNIYNRRMFDEYLDRSWQRSIEEGKSISLAVVDLDHFKLLNDTFGHQVGDDCLIKVGEILKRMSNRLGFFCARYGGEEFAIIWLNTPFAHVKEHCLELANAIRELSIANPAAPTSDILTTSMGLAELKPMPSKSARELISQADSLLYDAKASGRNCLVFRASEMDSDEQISLHPMT